jgi:hypothetical protein
VPSRRTTGPSSRFAYSVSISDDDVTRRIEAADPGDRAAADILLGREIREGLPDFLLEIRHKKVNGDFMRNASLREKRL